MMIVNGVILIAVLIILTIYALIRKKDISGQKAPLIFIKQHLYIWLIVLFFNVLSIAVFFYQQREEAFIRIEKENYDGRTREVMLELSQEDESREISLAVSPKTYTSQDAYEKMEEAFDYLEENMKGENSDLKHIVTDLDFSLDEEHYPFLLTCSATPYGLIQEDGIVKNDEESLNKFGFENAKSGILVTLKLTLSYNLLEKEKEFELVVYPENKTKLQQNFDEVAEELNKKEKAAVNEDYLDLPVNMNGINIKKIDNQGITSIHILFFGLILAGLLFLREQENKRQEQKIRKENLYKSYPWFVNELLLLLGAGMQVKNIFRLLIDEFERNKACGEDNKNRNVLIEELQIACHSLEVGMSEPQIYYQLGRRLQLPCYIRLMTLLEQNVKKGSKGIFSLLEQEEQNALEERKNLAKRYGEEAGTKLLGPMILLLIIIMLIIMLPAFMSFQ